MIILIVALFIFLHTCLIWVWYRCINNPTVVDVGWASGLTLSGLIYLFSTEIGLRTWILGSALIIWGMRLGGYLWYTRIHRRIIDKRYQALSENWKIAKPLGFFLNFQLQGVLIFIISIPWYFASLKSSAVMSQLDWAGLGLFAVAIMLETLSDRQLTQFKKQFPGKVCNVKLWRYCRHPNYFFDWLSWCAFAMFGLFWPEGLISLISPLTLYLVMTRITAPLTERGSIQSRGDEYIQYQKITPLFFPFSK
jgi:steroid 5-alpha reductase family enzyme